MLETLGIYIKTAVDIEREILAGGGQLHADCEASLLEDGSQQKDIWGADWIPFKQEVAYESLINLRGCLRIALAVADSAHSLYFCSKKQAHSSPLGIKFLALANSQTSS